MRTGIHVHNAGVALLNSYIPMLFERLGLVSEHQFISAEAQKAAVHYLQYVITGMSQTEEHLLPLNKMLCGQAIDMPAGPGITISAQHKATVESLLNAAIGYWPAIGHTSIEGFRGNWLVRNGVLTERADKWELTVEKRPYDLLIHKSPFSFSIIKYPWMHKPLHVSWPY